MPVIPFATATEDMDAVQEARIQMHGGLTLLEALIQRIQPHDTDDPELVEALRAAVRVVRSDMATLEVTLGLTAQDQ